MATTGVVIGTDMLLYSAGNALAHSTSCSMSLTGDTIETSSKDSNDWSTFKAGRRGGTASCDGLVALDSSYNVSYLFGLLNAKTAVIIRMSTETTGDKYLQASAILTGLDITSGDNESATYSASFQITGPVSEVTLT